MMQFLQVEMPEFIFNENSGDGIHKLYKKPCIIGCIQRKIHDEISTRVIFPDLISRRRIKCQQDSDTSDDFP